MHKAVTLVICSIISASAIAAERLTPIKDRNTLCAVEFGRFADGVYVGSTPMEDACRTEHYASRKKICTHNYEHNEIINACVLTYDAITERIRIAESNR